MEIVIAAIAAALLFLGIWGIVKYDAGQVTEMMFYTSCGMLAMGIILALLTFYLAAT